MTKIEETIVHLEGLALAIAATGGEINSEPAIKIIYEAIDVLRGCNDGNV